MPSSIPNLDARTRGSCALTCWARSSVAVPADGSVVVSGLVVAAYGIVLAAGYAMVPGGAAFVAVGAAIARIGAGQSGGVAAWLARTWSKIVAFPQRIAGLGRTWRRRIVTVAVTVGLLLPGSAVAASAGVPTHALGGGADAVMSTSRIGSAPAVSGFGGLTSQSLPAYLELSRDGRTIRRTVTALAFVCGSGDRFMDADGFLGLPVSGAGRFSGSYRLPPRQVGTDEVADSGSIRGQFDRRRASVKGTWTETVSFRDTGTGRTDTCSASARFTLRR